MNRRLTLLLANLPGIAANFSSCQREMNIAKRGARSATDADNPSIIEELVVSFSKNLSEKIGKVSYCSEFFNFKLTSATHSSKISFTFQ